MEDDGYGRNFSTSSFLHSSIPPFLHSSTPPPSTPQFLRLEQPGEYVRKVGPTDFL